MGSYENNEHLVAESLTNALLASGFDTVFKALAPFHEWGHQSRVCGSHIQVWRKLEL